MSIFKNGFCYNLIVASLKFNIKSLLLILRFLTFVFLSAFVKHNFSTTFKAYFKLSPFGYAPVTQIDIDMQFLTSELVFPPVSQTTPQGILAVGGDLSPERLLLAYEKGIFPWFEDDEPILWWCPEKRMVLFFEEFKPSHSVRNIINRGVFKVTFNTVFTEVMQNCQAIKRKGQYGTWITSQMITSYTKLHEMGKAISVEVWQDNDLVGGLYGVDLGHVFCGESMFSKVSNASKIAFTYLVNYLKERNYKLIDCQVYNDHLHSLGCREISRDAFISLLK